jgi:hypothetical protein
MDRRTEQQTERLLDEICEHVETIRRYVSAAFWISSVLFALAVLAALLTVAWYR